MNQLYMIMQILAHGLSEGSDANSRATSVWKNILKEDQRPQIDDTRLEALQRFIANRTAEGVRHQRAELQTEAVLRRFSN